MKSKNILFASIFAFAGVGAVFVLAALAGVNPVSIELNDGSLAKEDDSASGGRFLLFEDTGPRPGHNCEVYKPLAPTGGGSVRRPMNQTELTEALKAAQPGDVIELSESGTYNKITYFAQDGYSSGTSDNPIVIQAAAGEQPVIDHPGSNEEAWRSGPIVMFEDVSNIMLRGLNIMRGNQSVKMSVSENIVVEHNLLSGAGATAVRISGVDKGQRLLDPSQNIRITCNEITDVAAEPLDEFTTGKVFEIGKVDHLSVSTVGDPRVWEFEAYDPSNSIVIANNEIHDAKSQIMQLHHGVHNVRFYDNYVHDLDIAHPGVISMISIGTRFVGYQPADVVVERNVFADIKRSNDEGLFILRAGHGGITIRNNLFARAGSNMFFEQDDPAGDGTTGESSPNRGWASADARDVTFVNNTVWGCLGSCVTRTNQAANLTLINNVTNVDIGGANTIATIGDFVGPLEADADSGSGIGSGFTLAAGSAAVDAGGQLDGFSDDLFGNPRPTDGNWDHGAIESQ